MGGDDLPWRTARRLLGNDRRAVGGGRRMPWRSAVWLDDHRPHARRLQCGFRGTGRG